MPTPRKERSLELSVTHDDGTIIPYCFEVEKSTTKEQHGHDGSGANITLYCDWLDRFKFSECLLGFAEIVDGGTAARRLHRFNTPTQLVYPAGKQTDNMADGWQYPVKVEIVGEGPYNYLENDTAPVDGFQYWPNYKYAVFTVQWASLIYNIYTDDQILFDSNYNEWLRNCIVEDKPGGKYTQDKQLPFKWVDDQLPVPFAPAFWDPFEDIVVRWFDVPWSPLKAVRTCLGHANEDPILAGAPGLPNGIASECAMLVGADIEWMPLKLGRTYRNITYYFRRIERVPRAPDTANYGHNHLAKAVTVSGEPGRQFVRISLDGTASTADNRNPLIPLTDFSTLFDVPASSDL